MSLTKPITRRALIVAVFTLIMAFSLTGPAHAETQSAEGQTVMSIEIQGNRNVSTETILAVIKTKVGDSLEQDKIREDLKAIDETGYFFNAGARFTSYLGGVRVVFDLVENPKVKAIVFKGNTVIKSDRLEVLMNTKPGEVLNTKKFNQDLERVLKYYYNEGYYARVSDVSVTSGDEVVIIIGELKVDKIKVEGYKKTKLWVITREIEMKSGDILSAKRLQEDMRRIYNLGIFQNVDVKLDPVSGTDASDVTFRVEERQTGSANFGVGWSSADGFVGYIEVAEENFLGKHQRVNLRWEFGGNKNMYELGFYEPWVDNSKTSLGFNIYNRTFERESLWQGDIYAWGGGGDPPGKVKVSERRRGGDLTVGRPLSLNARAFLTLKIEDVDISILSDGVGWNSGKDPSGETRSLALSVINDTRDNFMNPTQGSRDKVSAELAGGFLGGDYHFGKYVVDASRYLKVGPTQVVALRLLTGLSSGKPPEHEQFKIGGSETIRGYKYGQFSGDRMVVLNAEYRFPVVKGLQGVIFADAGDAWATGEAMNLSDLSVGYGLGARIDTPIGILRIDYGVGKEGGQTYFSFGQSF